MIRVLIADDHYLVRQSLKTLLAITDDIEVIGEAEDGREAVELTRQLAPDVVVMDVIMPHLSGIQATEQISNLGVTTRVVALSIHSDKVLVEQSLQHGACGYLLKNLVAQELPWAIRAINRGETYFSPPVAEMLM